MAFHQTYLNYQPEFTDHASESENARTSSSLLFFRVVLRVQYSCGKDLSSETVLRNRRHGWSLHRGQMCTIRFTAASGHTSKKSAHHVNRQEPKLAKLVQQGCLSKRAKAPCST